MGVKIIKCVKRKFYFEVALDEHKVFFTESAVKVYESRQGKNYDAACIKQYIYDDYQPLWLKLVVRGRLAYFETFFPPARYFSRLL